MQRQTGIVWEDLFLEHDTGPGHPERAARLTAIQKVLEGPIGTKLVRLETRAATDDEIALIHPLEYIRRIDATAGRSLRLDPDTAVSPRSSDAARHAVGGVLTAVDWLLAGSDPGRGVTGGGVPLATNRNAFAFVRPPGHHAERERAMGFCLFNNVAIAAEYAVRKSGLKRVMIIDYDVHHGNGTQAAFYDRDDVFYISTHRYPFYPGTGARREEGEGRGKGFTLNIPFPGGEGDHEYLTAFEREIIPVTNDYRPELVLVSAGYDAHRLDPLGGMNVTAEGFGEMTEKILTAADELCAGRVVLVLEGGYSLEGLSQSVAACLQKLGG